MSTIFIKIAEAYNTIRNAREGTLYRKYGGPRGEVVSDEKAEWIREKEMAVGTFLCDDL